jgi:type I restriction enzyme M protein
VVALKEKLKALKAVNSNHKKIEVLEAKSQEQDKAAREAEAKADALDAAVFDLKAVNPNAVVRIDARTPEEVILSIGDQVEIAAQALKTLRALLQA